MGKLFECHLNFQLYMLIVFEMAFCIFFGWSIVFCSHCRCVSRSHHQNTRNYTDNKYTFQQRKLKQKYFVRFLLCHRCYSCHIKWTYIKVVFICFAFFPPCDARFWNHFYWILQIVLTKWCIYVCMFNAHPYTMLKKCHSSGIFIRLVFQKTIEFIASVFFFMWNWLIQFCS